MEISKSINKISLFASNDSKLENINKTNKNKKKLSHEKLKNTKLYSNKNVKKINNNNISEYKDSENEKVIVEDISNNDQLQNIIKSKIFYLEITTENNKFYKFSFSKACWNTLTIS